MRVSFLLKTPLSICLFVQTTCDPRAILTIPTATLHGPRATPRAIPAVLEAVFMPNQSRQVEATPTRTLRDPGDLDRDPAQSPANPPATLTRFERDVRTIPKRAEGVYRTRVTRDLISGYLSKFSLA